MIWENDVLTVVQAGPAFEERCGAAVVKELEKGVLLPFPSEYEAHH